MFGLPENLAKAAAEKSVEKANEPLTSGNFLEKLKDVKFDPEEAIQESVNAVNSTRGFKLVKAEALAETGRITTVDEMEEASSKYDLDRADLEAFINLNGGDKFLEKLFVYGVSRMKQDFYRQEKDFSKKSVGYKTFEDAFDAGAYDIKPDMFHVIMYGLSVTEYQHRNERFKTLERRLKKSEKTKPDEGGLIGEAKDKVSDIFGTDKLKKKEKKEVPTTMAQKAYRALIALGHAFMIADGAIVDMKAKYPDSFRGIELSPFYKLDDRREYELKFLGAVRLPAAGQDISLQDALADISILTDENIDKLTDGYADELNKKMDMMNSVLTALYIRGGNGIDPRGLNKNSLSEEGKLVRVEAIDRAKEICPDIEYVEKRMNYLSNAYRSFVVMANTINQ